MQRKRIGGRRKKENYFENNAGKNSTESILETKNSPGKTANESPVH